MYKIWQIWKRLAGFFVEYVLRLKFIKIITWKSPCNHFSHSPKACIMGITDIVTICLKLIILFEIEIESIGIHVEIVSPIAKIKTTSTVAKPIQIITNTIEIEINTFLYTIAKAVTN